MGEAVDIIGGMHPFGTPPFGMHPFGTPPFGTHPPGLLVLAATPIGDVADAPPRLAAELRSADIVAAEDTRRLRWLTGALGVPYPPKVVSFYDAVEESRSRGLVEALQGGARVLVVTDAGMPSVSDPGYRLVRAAIEAGVPVTVVPGASAALAALAVSGLPADRFCFEGFLPRRAGERARRLRELAAEPRTMVFFESPRRLAAALAALAGAFGADRPAAVCRELTKIHEEVRRGGLAELASWAAGGVRGEVTVVVAGAPAQAAPEAAELARRVAELEEAGQPRKAAIKAVAEAAGVPKRAVYDAVIHRE
jgi:16S rRNA (cytidine1402-2'-O)-methyltransferase